MSITVKGRVVKLTVKQWNDGTSTTQFSLAVYQGKVKGEIDPQGKPVYCPTLWFNVSAKSDIAIPPLKDKDEVWVDGWFGGKRLTNGSIWVTLNANAISLAVNNQVADSEEVPF